jgi:hypothetical protein
MAVGKPPETASQSTAFGGEFKGTTYVIVVLFFNQADINMDFTITGPLVEKQFPIESLLLLLKLFPLLP